VIWPEDLLFYEPLSTLDDVMHKLRLELELLTQLALALAFARVDVIASNCEVT
jgi:hypothetical protein